MTRIGIVITSTRPTRIGHHVASWIADQAPEGVAAELVDLAAIDLPFLADPQHPKLGEYELASTRSWAETVSSYDGLVIALAEYNGGYTAPLKNAIDTLFAEWNDKPVGVVGYGWGGAARAVTALGPVLQTVGATQTDGPGLSFTEHLTVEGEILETAPAQQVRELLEQVASTVPVAA